MLRDLKTRIFSRLSSFPGAYHAFDNVSFPTRTAFLGSWLEYNAGATEGAVKELKDFLHRNLDE